MFGLKKLIGRNSEGKVALLLQIISLTSVRVGFSAVSILQTIAPRPLIACAAGRALQLSIAAFEPLRPLPSVLPAALAFNSDAMPLALRPGSLVAVAAWPRVHAQDFKAVAPGPCILSLTLWSCADPSAMGFSLLPPPAVRPPIIKVKPASSGHAWNRFRQILRMSRKRKQGPGSLRRCKEGGGLVWIR